MIWSENNCIEGNDHVVIGDQNYYVSGDGYLMPAGKVGLERDNSTAEPLKTGVAKAFNHAA